MFEYKCGVNGINGIGNRRLTNMDNLLYVAFVVFDGHRGNSCVHSLHLKDTNARLRIKDTLKVTKALHMLCFVSVCYYFGSFLFII